MFLEFFRVFKDVKNFYFVMCCLSIICNVGGFINLERDLLDEIFIEEEVVVRVECLGWVNFFLCFVLIFFSIILI